MKKIIHELLPPMLWKSLKSLQLLTNKKGYIEWEYMPNGWETVNTDPKIKGWNVESILDVYKSNWSNFLNTLEGTLPLGMSPENSSDIRLNLTFHNLMMTYAYALTLASRHKPSISMLDWGGGIGHYYLISKNLVPDLDIDYHCKDFSTLAKYGQSLFPQSHFYSDDTCLDRKYDFVLASSVLQYSQNWLEVFQGLARSTSGYLFVTRIPIVQNVPSFVIVQRPYQYGYNTEYLGWCFNRQEFLSVAKEQQLQLIREFIVEELPHIHNAPEQPDHWGFLFYKN